MKSSRCSPRSPPVAGRAANRGIDRQGTGGLHHGKQHFAGVKIPGSPQLFDEVVHRETPIPQFLLHDLSVPDHHFGAAAEETAGGAAAHGEPGDEHLKADNGENRHNTARKGRMHILNGQGGDIGDENGHHQFTGLQLADLPFAHDPEPCDDQQIEQNGSGHQCIA